MALIALTKSSIVGNSFNNFKEVCKTVTTTTITGNKTYTIQNYANGYSDKLLENEDNYPMIIIHAPTLNTFSIRREHFDLFVEMMSRFRAPYDK